MIGGRRYLKDDFVPVYDYDHSYVLKPWHEVFTDDELLIEAVNSPPGFGGINWDFLGYLLIDFADDVPGHMIAMMDSLADLLSTLVDEEVVDKLNELLAPTASASVPLFGVPAWDRELFPTGRLNLAMTSKLILGIAAASYLIKKIPGLAIGLMAFTKRAKARAVITNRHTEIVGMLEGLQMNIQQGGHPVHSRHTFELFDELLNDKAIKSLSDGLLFDRKAPIQEFNKTYPHFGELRES
uniref:Uncharacterized protein n=1 Tax=viral metagenome TaxID=1070528 RepID=A0A2V0R9E3_9ZZZZ